MEGQPTIARLLLPLGGGLSLLNWGAVVVPWWSGKFHSALPLVGRRGVAGLVPADRGRVAGDRVVHVRSGRTRLGPAGTPSGVVMSRQGEMLTSSAALRR